MLSEPTIEKEEVTDQKTSFVKLHKIILHNDDITPYDFVISVLVRFFKLTMADAEGITWQAHTSGAALVAVLPLSEAQSRVGRAYFAASLEGYPLTFTIEPE